MNSSIQNCLIAWECSREYHCIQAARQTQEDPWKKGTFVSFSRSKGTSRRVVYSPLCWLRSPVHGGWELMVRVPAGSTPPPPRKALTALGGVGVSQAVTQAGGNGLLWTLMLFGTFFNTGRSGTLTPPALCPMP